MATQHDNRKEYAAALREYERGTQILLDALKQMPDGDRKAALRLKAIEYIERAEALKRALAPPAQRGGGGGRGAGAAGGRGGATGGRGSAAAASRGSGGAEGAALRSQLDGAIVSEKPNVRWDDVAGLADAKAALQEAAVLPIRFPDLFQGERKPWRGILLYGPPGTGKSHLAKAVATEVDATFFSVSSSDLVSKWVGESEKLVRALFEEAARRRPAIIFIDEVDALASTRRDGESDASRRLKNELLVRMSAIESGVLVLGATNIPWELDAAVRRRFERRVYIPLPDEGARRELLRIHLGETPHSLAPSDLDRLASRTMGLSGADVSVLVRDALLEPVRALQAATHFRQGADGRWSRATRARAARSRCSCCRCRRARSRRPTCAPPTSTGRSRACGPASAATICGGTRSLGGSTARRNVGRNCSTADRGPPRSHTAHVTPTARFDGLAAGAHSTQAQRRSW